MNQFYMFVRGDFEAVVRDSTIVMLAEKGNGRKHALPIRAIDLVGGGGNWQPAPSTDGSGNTGATIWSQVTRCDEAACDDSEE